jgi:hypothetical protein
MPADREHTPKITQRLGVPSETRLQEERQRENEAESRRHSNITPAGRIENGWQIVRKLTQRQWSGRGMVTLWLIEGVPCIALMVAGVLGALTRSSTPTERAWGFVLAVLLPGLPLIALAALTRKWLQQRKFDRAVRRRI